MPRYVKNGEFIKGKEEAVLSVFLFGMIPIWLLQRWSQWIYHELL